MHGKILLVGTVFNVAKTVERELKVVSKALSLFDSIDVFLVESDSDDETKTILAKIKSENSNFDFEDLGYIREKYSNRVDRIAFCRNIYVQYIRNNYKKYKWNYVAVADLDGMNFKLNKKGIRSCLEIKNRWDGIMANQKFGYYDIYALRADNWVETDCFVELEQLKNIYAPPKQISNKFLNFIYNFKHYDRLRKLVIYNRMKILPKNSQILRVKSAFGGFAIYKTQFFLFNDYSRKNITQNNSEHVSIHLAANNSYFYINPKLINSWLNEYNINRFFPVRFLRELKKHLKSNFMDD